MKMKKCPYCGKRITYSSAFASRQKGEYVCLRCGKESKVIIDKKIIMVYLAFLLVAVAIMIGWIIFGELSNPWGVVAVALPFVIFTLVSTKFLNYEPLKKYKKSMEARKAGIEYSDNLSTAELENTFENKYSDLESTTGFKINSDVFNKIKAERVAARQSLSESDNIISNSSTVKVDIKGGENAEGYVPVKASVSQEYSNDDTPLKKLHSERTVRESSEYSQRTSRHYVSEPKAQTNKTDKKADNRYTANRKF